MDADFGKLSRLRVDVHLPSVALGDNVVTQAKAQSGALPGWFGGKEGLKDLVKDVTWYTHTVILYP